MIIECRLAVESDAHFISKLALFQINNHLSQSMTQEGVESLNAFLSEQNVTSLMNKNHHFFIATYQRKVVGIAGIKDFSHLMALFVEDEYKRQDIGRRLWEFVKTFSESKGNHSNFTLNSSISAVHFYEKLGFIKISDIVLENGIPSVPMLLKHN